MKIITKHPSLKLCSGASSKPNPRFLLCHPNQSYDRNPEEPGPVRLETSQCLIYCHVLNTPPPPPSHRPPPLPPLAHPPPPPRLAPPQGLLFLHLLTTPPPPCKSLTSRLTTLPQNPEPSCSPKPRKSSSVLQPQPLFVLRVRKAEDRPVGVIIPPLPEEVFV